MSENKQEKVTTVVEKQSKTFEIVKESLILAFIFALSCIAIFGIYNTFAGNLITMISDLEKTSNIIGNFIILIIFTVTMFYLSSIYIKRKEAGDKLKLMLSLMGVLAIIGGIMALLDSILHPVLIMLVIGISFMLFKMTFNTIGILGTFFSLAIFITIPILAFRYNMVNSGSALFTILQFAMVLLLFIGATYPRIRNLIFKIGTRDNVELDGNGSAGHNDTAENIED